MQQSAAQAISPAEGWDTKDHPWRRFAARLLDLSLLPLPIELGLGFGLEPLWPEALDWVDAAPRYVHGLVFTPLIYVLTAIISGLCIAHWGSTPGKWLFGIKVLGRGGELLSGRQSLLRELRLFWWGVGLGVSLLAIIMMIRSFIELEGKHSTRWDRAVGAAVYGRTLNGKAWTLIAAGMVLLIGFKVMELYPIVSEGMERLEQAGQEVEPADGEP